MSLKTRKSNPAFTKVASNASGTSLARVRVDGTAISRAAMANRQQIARMA